jgi:putative nucleotidyltransferase with HDIG domain
MPIQKLLSIIQDIAAGKYSNDIMPLTGEDTPEPVRTIAEAMGMMMVKVEAREFRLENMLDELRALNLKIRNNAIATVSTIANSLAARDTYTVGHAERVADYAVKIARTLGMDDEAVEFVRLGGILHDIGKIGFPDDLFNPHNKKNPPEMVKKITHHPAEGAAILKNLDFLGPAVDYVHCHHERPDGKGYPRCLKASKIPLGASILAVADAFDAMTTDRPYQKGLSVDEALSILKEEADKKWDRDCVNAFAQVLEQEKSEMLNSSCAAKKSFDLIDVEHFLSLLNLQKGSIVADLACGIGSYTFALSKHVGPKGQVFAVDMWQKGITEIDHRVQQEGWQNIITLRADIRKDIPIASKNIDLCLMAEVMNELVKDNCLDGALKECRRVLRKKGHLAILEFSKDGLSMEHPDADRLTPEQIFNKISTCGFEFQRVERLGSLCVGIFIKEKGTF